MQVFVEMSDGTGVDEPVVSDWLVSAYSSLTGAMGEASEATAAHKTATDAIDVAKSSKTLADAAHLMIWVDYWYKVDSEHGSGVDDLASAQTMCESEDFASAVTYANSAKTHFDDAVYWSTQEEPDPVVESNDEDDSSIWPDSGGGNDYYEDGGNDYYEDSSDDWYEDSSDDWYDDGGSWIYPQLVFYPYNIQNEEACYVSTT